ncbi:glycosyltransferase [Desulfovibrio aerotolerans]|uniref:Glycosyltransferase n=1 Tax=Solidesulfovibrio aerotolerans TaxID=295255 RepID=A0A7C9IU36_9BACT|nr:glycosyltransferase family 1 protein [Solidesulfovibrio aerotolerans]MYL85287.1 glycosyltransferase [Solidesulfovibrio aerotolerans]
MKIGFDVSQTGAGKAGCGYFAAGLLAVLADLETSNEYVLYPAFGDFFREPQPKACSRPAGRRFHPGPTFRRFWDQKRFFRHPPADFEARLGNPDIVHANNFFCPSGLTRARLVYTLYDLSFLIEPAWTTEGNRTGCFDGVFRAATSADYLVAISEYSLNHYLSVFPNYPKNRTVVAPLASRFGPQSLQEKPAALGDIGSGDFWLCVGTIEPRKNHERLFAAYAAWRRDTGGTMPLVLAGGKGWLMDDVARTVEELGIAEHLRFTGYVSDAELAWLYASCHAFLYPSLFEGFGLPVLEAMSLGAAVICSNATSLPEVAGDAAIQVDPLDVAGLASAMATLTGHTSLRDSLRQRALTRAGLFSWEKTARIVAEAYARVVSLPPAWE